MFEILFLIFILGCITFMIYAMLTLRKRLNAAQGRYEHAERMWYDLEKTLAEREEELTQCGRNNGQLTRDKRALESKVWVTEQLGAASQRRADRLNDELVISQVFLELALDPDLSLGSVRAHELFGTREPTPI